AKSRIHKPYKGDIIALRQEFEAITNLNPNIVIIILTLRSKTVCEVSTSMISLKLYYPVRSL
ncbi:hypothetical protein, partial [Marivirga sp.]|uniref:hypothetical protein n=1 Tax=Marivirga sp. TaxID=2018662 RepID=UPI0025FA20C5